MTLFCDSVNELQRKVRQPMPRHGQIHGFTLIELSVVLIIVSLMLSFGLEATQSTSKSDCYAKTRVQMRTIQSAIDKYVANNGKYPKPASLTAGSQGVADPELGAEVSTFDSAKIKRNATQYTQGTNSKNIDDSSPTTDNQVLIGALPFKTLGLPFSYSADCWGNRFRYMVTEVLTDSSGSGFGDDTKIGTIFVETGNISSTKTTESDGIVTTSAAYAVISHGANGYSAAPRGYTGAVNNLFCSNSADSSMERQNCDNEDNIIVVNTYRDSSGSAQASGVAENRFDDLVLYGSKPASAVANQNCSATTIYWGGGPYCAASIGGLTNGTTVSVANDYSLSDTDGTAKVSCMNGKLSISNTAVCGDESAICSAGPGTIQWGAGNACTNNMSVVAQSTIGGRYLLQNQTAGYTGTATIVCGSDGNWGVDSSTCTRGCAGVSTISLVQWDSDGATNCRSAIGFGPLRNGESTTVTNTNTGFVGTKVVSCNNGTITYGAATCAVSSGNCAAGTVYWSSTNGGNCSASVGALTNGATTGVTSTSNNGSGTATVACNLGTARVTSGTCNATCPPQTLSWSASGADSDSSLCSGPSSLIVEGGTGSIVNTTSYRTGTMDVRCTNGILDYNSGGAKTCTYTNKNMYCWGNGTAGQLGVGGNVEYNAIPTPVMRDGRANYSFITTSKQLPEDVIDEDIRSPSNLFTCGIIGTGSYCWGDNSIGQLGNGDNDPRLQPTSITGGLAFSYLAAGSLHNCGLLSSGKAYCWGNGSHGRLGNGRVQDRTYPDAVSNHPTLGALQFSSISPGRRATCAVQKTTGAGFCWGTAVDGTLGNGTITPNMDVPSAVSGGLSFTKIGVGRLHACGLTTGGEIYCWGSCDDDHLTSGCLGNNNTPPHVATTPTKIAGSATYSDLAVGQKTTCAIRISNGLTYCWGVGSNGQLGHGSATNKDRPTAISGGHLFTKISTGGILTCGLKSNGEVWCWGDNSYGEIGNGTIGNGLDPSNPSYVSYVATPTQVSGSGSTHIFTDLSVGFNYACAITAP